jgi:hypothetical protein
MRTVDGSDGTELGQQPVNRRARYAGNPGQRRQLPRPADLRKHTQQPEGTIQHSSARSLRWWCGKLRLDDADFEGYGRFTSEVRELLRDNFGQSQLDLCRAKTGVSC